MNFAIRVAATPRGKVCGDVSLCGLARYPEVGAGARAVATYQYRRLPGRTKMLATR